MKFSAAILMNGMVKPQGFGPDSISSEEAPCALGGALQSVGRQIVGSIRRDRCASLYNLQTLSKEWPWADECREYVVMREVLGMGVGTKTSPVDIVWRMNDLLHWSRAQIAEWVASVEPQESPEPVSEFEHILEAV